MSIRSFGRRSRKERSCFRTGSRILRWRIRDADEDSATDTVLALDKIACRGLKPDLTLLMDIDLATSLARAETPQSQA